MGTSAYDEDDGHYVNCAPTGLHSSFKYDLRALDRHFFGECALLLSCFHTHTHTHTHTWLNPFKDWNERFQSLLSQATQQVDPVADVQRTVALRKVTPPLVSLSSQFSFVKFALC